MNKKTLAVEVMKFSAAGMLAASQIFSDDGKETIGLFMKGLGNLLRDTAYWMDDDEGKLDFLEEIISYNFKKAHEVMFTAVQHCDNIPKA